MTDGNFLPGNPVSIELFELDKLNEQANLDEAEEKT
ncbi:hypothetical protein HDC92_001959 [Pedobacter sp. AK017]|nr:hypothetical protein [Pedobacter sp. AK017]